MVRRPDSGHLRPVAAAADRHASSDVTRDVSNRKRRSSSVCSTAKAEANATGVWAGCSSLRITERGQYRARQLYKNISMLFLFPVKDGKLSTGVNATFNASCYLSLIHI